MRHQLRDYQTRAVEAVIASLDRRPILVAPTGSGKTTMATAIVERLGRPTLWLAHRKELIDQAARRLAAHGLHAGIIMSGQRPDAAARVQVASVQTLVRRNMPTATLVIIDECHHAAARTYGRVLENYKDAALIGLTATPFRLDGRGLGDIFGELVIAAWPDELCDAGVLHKPRVWAAKAPDLRGVHVTRGDYRIDELAERTNTTELVGDIVTTWQKRAAGKRTVAFAVNVDHSESIAESFRRAGVPAEHLDGTTPRAERDAILARLASGETLVVSNCMVLTEGWDLPELECAIIARPTASLNLHLQIVGRIMRAAHGKDGAIVLDHAGNHLVHGLVTRRLMLTLEPGARVGMAEPLNLRRCKECGLLFELTATKCPACGWDWKVELAARRPPTTRPGELVELLDEPAPSASFTEMSETWRALEAQRQAAGYKPGWSYYRFIELFGARPLVVDGELVNPGTATRAQKRALYESLLGVAAAKGYSRGWAAHRFRARFGHWPKFSRA